MTRHYSRRDLSRPPYPARTKRVAVRYNPIYYLRGIFFPRIFLSFLSFKFSPHPWTRGMLTTHRANNSWPIWSAAPQYSCFASIRSNSNMSTSQPHGRRTKTSHSISCSYNSTRIVLHSTSGYRILWSPIYNCRRSIWLNILCSYRVSWSTRYYWINLFSCMPSTPSFISLHIRPPLWFWSCRLILTLRRRSLTIPLRINLLMRLIKKKKS